jgi:hypothetical protein
MKTPALPWVDCANPPFQLLCFEGDGAESPYAKCKMSGGSSAINAKSSLGAGFTLDRRELKRPGAFE